MQKFKNATRFKRNAKMKNEKRKTKNQKITKGSIDETAYILP
jgi:hypothetical protein